MATMNRGFTLIEMVVVAGLVGVLSVGIVSIFISTIQGNYRAKLQAEVKEQGDYAITSMERTIRNSKTAPKCPSSTVVTFSSDVIQYRFNAVDETIERSNDTGGSWIPIVDGISITSVNFDCKTDPDSFTNGKVGITFTATASNNAGELGQVFETTVAIRNID
jgi:prepilin-type N-terminal cleavage/methylation domain-containing protein